MFRPSDHDVELSEEEFRLLRDFIHENFGLFFDDSQRSSLRARLAGRLATLDLLSFEDYYHYLRFGPQKGQEMQSMVSHLTNNETYFFREQPQLQVLSDHVLRGLRDRKTAAGDRHLRILSAGCSTGEEAYTLAMIVHDSGHFFWNWDVKVVGMDVDSVALEKARRAVYFHNSFRAMTSALRGAPSRPRRKRGAGEGIDPPFRFSPGRQHTREGELRGACRRRTWSFAATSSSTSRTRGYARWCNISTRFSPREATSSWDTPNRSPGSPTCSPRFGFLGR